MVTMCKHQTFRQGRYKAKWWFEVQRLYSSCVYRHRTFTLNFHRLYQEMNLNKTICIKKNACCNVNFISVQFRVYCRQEFSSVSPCVMPRMNIGPLQTYVATTIWSSLATSTTFSSSASSSDWCPVPSWVGFSRKLCTKFWISPRASVAKKTGEIKTNHYHETLL